MDTQANPGAARRPGCLTAAAVILGVITITVLITLWVARTWLFPQPFEPVTLGEREQVALDAKLTSLFGAPAAAPRSELPPPSAQRGQSTELRPEPYRERAEDRVVHFNQRELNALIARNPDLSGRLAVHLGRDMISATMLITLPPDLPVFASQTVRIASGLRLGQIQGRPTVAIEGVSIMGVPLPSAWLGGLKGQDLVATFGPAEGFWSAFGDGVRDLRVEDGRLRIELAE